MRGKGEKEDSRQGDKGDKGEELFKGVYATFRIAMSVQVSILNAKTKLKSIA
jgi:hypothetical protein